MPDQDPLGDLVAAVAGALRGDRAQLRDAVAAARERAAERVRDGFEPRDQMRRATVLPALPPPAVAHRRNLAAVAHMSAVNDARAFEALRRHRTAIGQMQRSHHELAERVDVLQQQGDQALIGLVREFATLQRRVRDVSPTPNLLRETARPQYPIGVRPLRPTRFRERRSTRLQQRQAQRLQQLQRLHEVRAAALHAHVRNVTTVVQTVQTAAYGEKGSVFATNNLLLAANQLVWSTIDPLLQGAGVDAVSRLVVAAVVPLGTLLTGHMLLGDRQHVRFISGVASFDGTTPVVVESLRGRVGESLWSAFSARTDVPVTATLLDDRARGPILASVVEGSVVIRLLGFVGSLAGAPFAPARVAWIVDTGEGGG